MTTVAKKIAKKYKFLEPDLKAYIAESIYEVLNDPDRGLELTDETKRRLRAAKNKKQKTVSLSELKKKYY